MTMAHNPALKIIPADQWQAWRQELADAGGTLAVVTGAFALLHPGNLAAIQEAARQASHVCVVIHPDDPASSIARQGAAMPSTGVRLEMAANLRAVSMVTTCSPSAAELVLARLRPFTLVDCLKQEITGITTMAIATEAIALAARKLADQIVDLAPVKGCFADDIQKAIQAGRTPVSVPDAVMPSQPNRADLDRFLDTGAPGRPACNPSADRRSIAGRPLVTVNGCFDILHLGHMRLLAQARNLGARLLVLVNDDDSVRTYKGAGRPIFPIRFRLHALSSLSTVDMAYPFTDDNPLPLLATIRPDIHVKGGSFEETRVGAERRLVESWGGRLEIIPLVKGFSSSNVVKRMAEATAPIETSDARRRTPDSR